MFGIDAMTMDKTGSGKIGKRTWVGFLGVGLACLGCCLAPLLGTVALAGAGAAMLGSISNHPILATLLAGSLGLALFWIWRSRKQSCCPNPSTSCSSNACWTSIPGCNLPTTVQAARAKMLRSDLFTGIESIVERPGMLGFRFEDTPKNIAGLTEFIRFERECCPSLRFGLEWESNGGAVTLELTGPAAILSSLKDIAKGRNSFWPRIIL